MRWRLLIEEYNPEIIYLEGKANKVADILSRAHTNPTVETAYTLQEYAARFDVNELTDNQFPLQYSLIDKAQQKDHKILKNLQKGIYSTDTFSGGEKSLQLITYKRKIVIPADLKDRVMQFYHTYLLHPGLNRTEATIQQHLFWPNM